MTPATIHRLYTACERTRLRLHFRRVLLLLRKAGTPAGLDRAARGRTILRLREYAAASRFPRHGGRGGPRPVFVDPGGVHCAVGFLLADAGFTGLVARVAAERNHARVADLADVEGMAGALRSIGITPAEAARIQPTYTTPSDCIPLFVWQAAAPALTFLVALGFVRGRRLRGRVAPLWRVARTAALVLLAAVAALGWSLYPWPAHRDPTEEPVRGGMTFSLSDPPLPLYCGCVFSPEGWRRLREW